jgi:hypothetical protein
VRAREEEKDGRTIVINWGEKKRKCKRVIEREGQRDREKENESERE